MNSVQILRYVHIGAGTLALLTFLLPMFLPKGGRAHRRVGWVFVAAMAVIGMSAAPLAVYRLVTIESTGSRLAAAFLLYITVLSFNAVWSGLRTLRHKDTGRHTNALDLGAHGLLSTSGLATATLGAVFKAPLFLIFGLIGTVIGIVNISESLNPSKQRMHWWFKHMTGRMGGSIAALTAFFVINAPKLGLATFGMVPWLLPGAILAPVTFLWARYYRRKFGLATPAAPQASARPESTGPDPALLDAR